MDAENLKAMMDTMACYGTNGSVHARSISPLVRTAIRFIAVPSFIAGQRLTIHPGRHHYIARRRGLSIRASGESDRPLA